LASFKMARAVSERRKDVPFFSVDMVKSVAGALQVRYTA
jgi:hypothetical protein